MKVKVPSNSTYTNNPCSTRKSAVATVRRGMTGTRQTKILGVVSCSHPSCLEQFICRCDHWLRNWYKSKRGPDSRTGTSCNPCAMNDGNTSHASPPPKEFKRSADELPTKSSW
eukprot:scaffold1501_cov352-Pavlova_lutheri.AAC.12